MKVPPDFHPRWREIVSGEVHCELEFLAAKILLGTLARTLAKDPAPACLERSSRELRELFAKSADIPSAQRDLTKIFAENVS